MHVQRPAAARGQTRIGWLDSRHSFSFGEYHDPRHMGISALRVLNDDTVAPAAGFPTHPHRDMEILTYVTAGVIAHADSTGSRRQVPAGEFQLMHAGTGIRHSEYNASPTDRLHFLQIWILPSVPGGEPGYEQRDFPRRPGIQVIAAPGGEGGALALRQDARVHRALLVAGERLPLPLAAARVGYLHVVAGALRVGDSKLAAADGLAISGEGSPVSEAMTDTEFLFFDLPPTTTGE